MKIKGKIMIMKSGKSFSLSISFSFSKGLRTFCSWKFVVIEKDTERCSLKIAASKFSK